MRPRVYTAREMSKTIRVLSDTAREMLVLSERPSRYYLLEKNGSQHLIGRHMSEAYNRIRAEAAERISNPEEKKKFFEISYYIRKNAQFGVTGMAQVF